jgi:O-acetyl-ADP-ribose deacetylase (regulator of RNase III)
MIEIEYLKGDARAPTVVGNKIIVHICNDVGGWGKGFVLAISNRWKGPESEYRRWYASRETNDFAIGAVQFVSVEEGLWVANMIAQKGINRGKSSEPSIRYEAVEACLSQVSEFATKHSCSLHMPRIGCGLAGGNWEEIESLIHKTCIANNVPVYVYDFA